MCMTAEKTDYPIRDFKNARDWHIYFVYNDPEFVSQVKKLRRLKIQSPTKERLFVKLATEFAIAPYDVFYFYTKQIIYLDKNITRKANLTFNSDTGKFLVEFDYDISREEFLELWKEFSYTRKNIGFRGKVSKRKPPESPELIYAIFKARKDKTFKEIFELYEKGKLEGFAGSAKQYKDEESLERYYGKFKPGSN